MLSNMTTNNSTIVTIIPENTSSDHGLPISAFSKGMLYTGYTLMFVVGCIGNSLVIYKTAIKRKSKKKFHDYQIVSLAIADLLGSIFIPMNMIHDITNYNEWLLLGRLGCKVVTSMNPFLTVTSAWMMVAIAITRFR